MTEAANTRTSETAKILEKASIHDVHAEETEIASQPRHGVPHSHENQVGHRAVHGQKEGKEHEAPDGKRA